MVSKFIVSQAKLSLL